MSDVRLTVGGRTYTVSCAPDQEEHVQHLAKAVDAKLAAMGSNLSSNEAKNLLFAALILADELDEARRAPAPPDTGQLAGHLERVATALENAAATLEAAAAGGSSQPL